MPPAADGDRKTQDTTATDQSNLQC